MDKFQEAAKSLPVVASNVKDTANMRTMFRKTKICNWFSSGRCVKDAKCKFAHYPDELKPPPNLYKTKLCPALFGEGLCCGAKCNYAHHENEIRSLSVLEEEQKLAYQQMGNAMCSMLQSTLRPVTQCSDESSSTASISLEHLIPAVVEGSKSKSRFWRTRLCRLYMSGTCSNGDSCIFAHGWDQPQGLGGSQADEMGLGKTKPTGSTDRIASNHWNVQPIACIQVSQPACNSVKMVAGVPPAGFTGEHGDLVVQNTFLSVVPRRPSRRALSLPAVMKLDT